MSVPDGPHLHDFHAVGPPRYRAPIGLPSRGQESRRLGVVVSVLLHVLLIGLLIVPLMMPGSVIERMQQGGGGAGPSGGGGGGSRGSGGTVERVQYVKLLRDPVATPTKIPAPVPIVPKVEPPKPTPVQTPPPKPPESQPPQQSVAPAAQTTVASAVSGTNGGSGADGSAGAGPGTGGGVGSGVGTGKGSANGAGTGGGTQANYSPTVIEMFLPPLPAPKDVRGMHFTAEFDVDSTGRVLDFRFTPTPNRDYNKRLAEVLRSTRFRPGTRPDGTPVRAKSQITYDF